MVMGGHIKGFHYGQNDRFITFYKPLLLGPWWYKNSSNRLKQFDFQIPRPCVSQTTSFAYKEKQH